MGKFPLAHEAFSPLTLSTDEQEALETLAEQQLESARAQLDCHVLQDLDVVDQRRWKSLKKREHITVYRERSSVAFHRQCHSRTQFNPTASATLDTHNDDDWPLPQLLGVGSLEGTLEDVMYGIHTPSAVHMMAKAAISEDEVVDAQVLLEFKGPTIAHPFRFLGLKWVVKAHPAAMGAVVLPRDVVYIEHTGIKTRADGSKLGHVLIHSVELPQCPDLRRELGLVRARVSSCVLLRQNAHDATKVDVFMTGRVAAQGRVLDSLALLSTANGLTYFWKASVCAQRRKLAWRLQHKRKEPPAATALAPSQCPLCTKALDRVFCSPTRCEMCGMRLCSRCSVHQKLLFPGAFGTKEVHSVSVELCTPCISSTTEESAVVIARQEIRAGQYGALTSPRGSRHPKRASAKPRRVNFSASAGPRLTRNEVESRPRIDFAASVGPVRKKDDGDDEIVTRNSLQALDNLLLDSTHSEKREDKWDEFVSREDEPINFLTPRQAPMKLEDLEGLESDESVDEGCERTSRTPQATEMGSSMPLWQRISALRVMAESTYRYTKKTTEKTPVSNSGCSPTYTSPSTLQ